MSYQLFYGLSEMMNFDTHHTSNHQNAAPSQPDPRVAAALDEIGFAYEVDALEASYFINLPIGDDRSHGVNIGSRTRQFMGAEMRRICSISFKSDGPFDPRSANLLLRENADHLVGSWSIVPDEGIHYAMFSLIVSATADGRTLGNLIELVAHTADAMEFRLTGLDEF